MGESEARECGFRVELVGQVRESNSTAQDTVDAARSAREMGAELLMFSGGDGTARDVFRAVGVAIPVVGIPAGVKMHSGVFASTPESAGELAGRFLAGRIRRLAELEVMDIDEDAFRDGVVRARLYGYLKVPLDRQLVQGAKAPTPPSERAAQQAIAAYVVDRMERGVLYFVGPGTTTRTIMEALGQPFSLLGVDAVLDRRCIGTDLNERQILEMLEVLDSQRASIVVSPIGGQGHIFGRGNQQLSPRIIRRVGKENVIVVATPSKLASLRSRPLMVDTGDRALDRSLSGYIRVITGYGEEVVYPVSF
jgi:predicted polyphosphate/ATP-dependent NAD kinase